MFKRTLDRSVLARLLPGMGSYNFRSREVQRVVRFVRPLPFVCEFYALRYTIELYAPPHCGGRVFVVGRLWDEPIEDARILVAFGDTVARQRMRDGFAVDVGSIGDVLFLRLMRQGDVEELVGPHQTFDIALTPGVRAQIEAFKRSGHAVD